MCEKLAADIKAKLTDREWNVVSYYVTVAEITGKRGETAIAHRALENAIAIALSNNMNTVANEISKYLEIFQVD